MARPRKDNMDYFPHDTDMSACDKVMALEAIHGDGGYAFYCKLLEQIYKTETGALPISAEWQKNVLCAKLKRTVAEFDTVLADCFKFGLFDKEIFDANGYLTSNGIQKRRDKVFDDRERARDGMQKKRSGNESAGAIEAISESQEKPKSRYKELKDTDKPRKDGLVTIYSDSMT
jgi:hypothetical protein